MHKTDPAEIIIGIDTHKETHAAVAIQRTWGPPWRHDPAGEP